MQKDSGTSLWIEIIDVLDTIFNTIRNHVVLEHVINKVQV